MKLEKGNNNNVADVTCMDPSLAPVVAEKVSKTVRLIGFLIQNSFSKSKDVVQDLQDVMRRGKNIGKALNNVMVRNHEALTCRPRDADMSFMSPLEYQFSCSSSPPRLSRAISSRRKLSPLVATEHDCGRMCRGTGEEGRRMMMSSGGSIMLREKPKKKKKEFHVDEAAEEFIDQFYRELRLQKWLDQYYYY